MDLTIEAFVPAAIESLSVQYRSRLSVNDWVVAGDYSNRRKPVWGQDERLFGIHTAQFLQKESSFSRPDIKIESGGRQFDKSQESLYEVYILMSETQTPPSKQKEIKQEEQEYDEFNVDSSMLLSKLEFEQPPESPRINYITAEAKIKQLTQQDPMPYKKSKPFCGCGQYYSCTSSLYLHIRSKHKGIPPANTIGGPKGIVKKPDQNLQDTVKIEQYHNTYQTYTNTPAKKAEIILPPQVASNYSGRRVQNNTPEGKKKCKICSKTYSCNSSLNLHLKRKHQIKATWDGRTQISPRVQDRTPKNFECSICGLNYASKSALGLHYNNKHSSKIQIQQGLPYDEDKVQKCGCGLVYQSRSALNMHVKKKHAGIYQKGTTQKPSLRTHSRGYRLQDGANHGQHYLVRNQGSSEEQNRSIYDSQSEQNAQKNRSNLRQGEEQKIYKCGCSKIYSCSSSLNLHIKRNHNWVVPQGTIGGPRGMRVQEEVQIPQAPPTCTECQALLENSYFHCRNCRKHFMCSGCFWKGDYFTEEHEWQTIK